MIEAICDNCGKRIVLEPDLFGLTHPRGWTFVTFDPIVRRELDYKVFCPECKEPYKKKVED